LPACSWLVEIHDVTSGRVGDATSDAVESGTTDVVASDAGEDAEASGATGCARHAGALFCADFSDSTPEKGWSRFPPNAGGTLSTDTVDPLSPPRALHR
jgi:hypothetical protein